MKTTLNFIFLTIYASPVKLIFNNKTQGDILWRDQLEKLAAEKPR